MPTDSGWDQVDFCFQSVVASSSEPAEKYIPLQESASILAEMAKDHFPAGPASAVDAHASYCDWKISKAADFFEARDRLPIPEAARPWRALVTSWENYSASQQWMLGEVHGKPQLSLDLQLKQQAQSQASWKDRRSSPLKSQFSDRSRGS